MRGPNGGWSSSSAQVRDSPPKNLRQTSIRLPVREPDSSAQSGTNPVREIFDDKICHEAILVSIVNQGTSATVKTTSFPAGDFGSSKVVRYSTGVDPSPIPIELRARTASFKWQVSPLLLYSLPWHRARTEPSRKVSCQSAYCRATLFGGSREKCFAFRSRSVDGTEYVTHFTIGAHGFARA